MITLFRAWYTESTMYCLFYLHKRLGSKIQNTIKLNQQCYVTKHKNLTSLLILKDVTWSNNINT